MHRELIATAAALLCCARSPACNVPVFRYALEHWRPDPYRVAVLHRDALSAGDRANMAAIEPFALVRAVDLSAEEPPAWLGSVRDEAGGQTLPRLALLFPAASGLRGRVWAGPLDADSVRTLLESPARSELARRLLEGHAAVWLLLESGNTKQDDEAAALLRTELRRLERTLRPPRELYADPDEPDSAPAADARVRFSMLRLAPNDPAEPVLGAMLSGSLAGLRQAGGPTAFPVFGRGRALTALCGAYLDRERVEAVCEFLVGACSCEAKFANPGMDLLIAMDWDAALAGALRAEQAPPALVGPLAMTPVAATSETARAAGREPASAATAEAGTTTRGRSCAVGLAVGVGVVAVLGLGTLLTVRLLRE